MRYGYVTNLCCPYFCKISRQASRICGYVAKGGPWNLYLYYHLLFFIAKDTRRPLPEDTNRSKTNRYFAGMLLAVLNLLPLPYWVYISITFAGFEWFTFEQPGIWAAVLASGMGTFAMLVVYVQFFRRKEEPKKRKWNMNYIIGFITAVISVITFIKILNDF